MASVITQIARKWNLKQHENLLSGRVNDIFVNLTFVKHVRKNDSMQRPDYNKSVENYLLEAIFQPKYEYVTIDFYVDRKSGIDEREVSGFLEEQYESYKTSLPTYVKGHFGITLYQRDTLNVKASYVIEFLKVMTGFFSENGYFSGCRKCGSDDNLSQTVLAGRATEICENCRLKEASF